jgi:hypothetical protein
MDTNTNEDTKRQRHSGLHNNLDKLIASYITNNHDITLRGTSINQLLEWSEEKHPDLYVGLVIISAQYLDEHPSTSLNDTSIFTLMVWSGRKFNGT